MGRDVERCVCTYVITERKEHNLLLPPLDHSEHKLKVRNLGIVIGGME